jgi:hypothetical protein|tara:strand:- start:514 stop:705 length:192 start_codon:yes stop_codon:yes gene_type:complete
MTAMVLVFWGCGITTQPAQVNIPFPTRAACEAALANAEMIVSTDQLITHSCRPIIRKEAMPPE